MTRIGIVIGSTRPGRRAEAVARWVHEIALQRDDAEFDLVDIADYALPLLDEPQPPSLGIYTHEHTRRWGATIAALDGYAFVTPEYNHSVPAALKNALDYLYAEWNDKACGFVSYGGAGGGRAVEALRPIVGALELADVRAQVSLSLMSDFRADGRLAPEPHQAAQVSVLLDQLVAWSEALAPTRRTRSAAIQGQGF